MSEEGVSVPVTLPSVPVNSGVRLGLSLRECGGETEDDGDEDKDDVIVRSAVEESVAMALLERLHDDELDHDALPDAAAVCETVRDGSLDSDGEPSRDKVKDGSSDSEAPVEDNVALSEAETAIVKDVEAPSVRVGEPLDSVKDTVVLSVASEDHDADGVHSSESVADGTAVSVRVGSSEALGVPLRLDEVV